MASNSYDVIIVGGGLGASAPFLVTPAPGVLGRAPPGLGDPTLDLRGCQAELFLGQTVGFLDRPLHRLPPGVAVERHLADRSVLRPVVVEDVPDVGTADPGFAGRPGKG